MLNGHLDVFPVGDRAAWARDPWSGEIADGRLHGRGTVDMKCGTTALLFVFAYLHRLRAALPGRVTLTVVSDEETGGKWGTGWLIENCAPEVLGDCVLNTEPCGARHRAVRREMHAVAALQDRREGRPQRLSAHRRQRQQARGGADPGPAGDRGDGARRARRRCGARLTGREVQQAIERSLGAGAADVMRRVSVNIGTIQGGVKINMLPAECLLEVDFRLPVGITPRSGAGRRCAAILARYPMVGVEELLPGGPEANRLRSDARDDGPSRSAMPARR